MARAVILSSTLVSLIKQRGYSTRAAVASAAARVGSTATTVSNSSGSPSAQGTSSSAATSWVPDPVTGYYMPGNKRADQVDAADMRAQFLSHQSNSSQ